MSEARWVKEVMLPLDDYALVPEDASMVDAYCALEEAQKRLPAGRQPSRAVLVVDKRGRIIGKVGQLAFLKALEPKYDKVGDLGALSRAGLSSDFINSMMDEAKSCTSSGSKNATMESSKYVWEAVVRDTTTGFFMNTNSNNFELRAVSAKPSDRLGTTPISA